MEAAIDTIPAQGTWSSCDFHEGMSAASMYIEVQLGKPSERSNRIVKQFCKESETFFGIVSEVKRKSKYYVVSVLGVMLGISSLVFTAGSSEGSVL